MAAQRSGCAVGALDVHFNLTPLAPGIPALAIPLWCAFIVVKRRPPMLVLR